MASLAVALVCDHAFGPVGLHRVQADIRPENGPSRRLVERLGFQREGLLRRYLDIDGDWRDHLRTRCSLRTCPAGCSPAGATRYHAEPGPGGHAVGDTPRWSHRPQTHQRHTARLPVPDTPRA